MKKRYLLIFLAMVFLFPFCKDNPTTPDPINQTQPAINSFSANPGEIASGQSSTLTWEVKNATKIEIDNGIGQVSASGSKQVNPEDSTTYTLTASNDKNQSVTKSCRVEVKKLEIVSFTASPSEISKGQNSTLSWEVLNSIRVEIDNGIGQVLAKASTQVSPGASTVYTLTAYNNYIQKTKTVSVIIKSDPIVYITNTGSKYHNDGCQYLSQSKIPISLSEACRRGYTPCSVCKPPQCPG